MNSNKNFDFLHKKVSSISVVAGALGAVFVVAGAKYLNDDLGSILSLKLVEDAGSYFLSDWDKAEHLRSNDYSSKAGFASEDQVAELLGLSGFQDRLFILNSPSFIDDELRIQGIKTDISREINPSQDVGSTWSAIPLSSIHGREYELLTDIDYDGEVFPVTNELHCLDLARQEAEGIGHSTMLCMGVDIGPSEIAGVFQCSSYGHYKTLLKHSSPDHIDETTCMRIKGQKAEDIVNSLQIF